VWDWVANSVNLGCAVNLAFTHCEERAEGDPRLVDLKPNGGALSGLTVVIQMKKTRRTPNICTAKSVHQKTFQGGRTVLMFLQI